MPQRATAAQIDLFSAQKSIAEPRLLVEWQLFWPQLLRNIADLFRPDIPLRSSSSPGLFWPDVFVSRPVSWKDFWRSVFIHSAAIFFFFMTGRYWLFPPAVSVREPFDNTTLTYYK